MTCDIVHRTVYRYSAPVTVSQHAARVEPRVLPNQHLESFSLRIEPDPSIRKVRTDYFGNRACFFSIQQVHSRLEIVAESRVTLADVTPPVLSLSPRWKEVARLFSDPVSPEVVAPYEFVFDSPLLRASPLLARILSTTKLPQPLRRHWKKSSKTAVESARTSPISPSRACVRSVWRPDMSAVTCAQNPQWENLS
jgi:transglutaminase-like putative cysteine protease